MPTHLVQPQVTALIGSWQPVPEAVGLDARRYAALLLQKNAIIISGGGPGIEHAALNEILKRVPSPAGRLKIVLPVSLAEYRVHLLKSASSHVVKKDEADDLIAKLNALELKAKSTLTALPAAKFDPVALRARNAAIIEQASELIAFQINDSADIEDVLELARGRKMPLKVLRYYV